MLLIACGSARHAATPGAEELSDFVLVIEEKNGQVHHSWQRATELDLSRFPPPKCLEEYLICLKLQGSHALQFHAASDAVEWLRRNRTELLVGTMVIIAGVAFVTLSAGAGAVVLAPMVLVAG
ncbi:hypothetical protein [Melittangium boletus]|uniref:hypothetical protein n=1 Tax=Melittangium boletus TaxID=83453 RepID=UPI0012FE5BB4|nr:hypothetical protein [Melittangium boletus]